MRLSAVNTVLSSMPMGSIPEQTSREQTDSVLVVLSSAKVFAPSQAAELNAAIRAIRGIADADRDRLHTLLASRVDLAATAPSQQVASRAKQQNYTAIVHYMTEKKWTDMKVTIEHAVCVISNMASKLGCSRPSEPTGRVIATMALVQVHWV